MRPSAPVRTDRLVLFDARAKLVTHANIPVSPCVILLSGFFIPIHHYHLVLLHDSVLDIESATVVTVGRVSTARLLGMCGNHG
jgi:hypothetical protein